MDRLFDFVRTFGASVGPYLGLIAILSLLELVIPFRKRRGGGGRVRTNLILLALFFLLNILLNGVFIGVAAEFERRGLGLLPQYHLPFWMLLAIGLSTLDFSSYVAHLLMHKLGALWRIHRVHHSDIHVDATTAFRQHPLEGLWRIVFTVGPALALGLPVAAIAIYRLMSGINAIFEHANLRLWRPIDTMLSVLIVTPNMHKVHHSRLQSETDSNYGNLFSVFDRLFATFSAPERAYDCEYGLDQFTGRETARVLLKLPFRKR